MNKNNTNIIYIGEDASLSTWFKCAPFKAGFISEISFNALRKSLNEDYFDILIIDCEYFSDKPSDFFEYVSFNFPWLLLILISDNNSNHIIDEVSQSEIYYCVLFKPLTKNKLLKSIEVQKKKIEKLKEKDAKLINYEQKFIENELQLTQIKGQLQHTDQDKKNDILKQKSDLEKLIQERTKELENAKTTISHSEIRFWELAELLPQTVFEIDLEGKLLFSNKYGFDSTGYSIEDIGKGINVYDLIPSNLHEKLYRNLQKLIFGNYEGPNEYNIIRKDGSMFPVLIYAGAIKKKSQTTGIRGVIVDITDRKKLENQLLKAKMDADAANNAKSAFLANMSHEIRTPMNAIIGFTDLLLGQVKNQQQIDYLGSIKYNAKKLLNIINDILDISKIESGTISLKKNWLSVPLLCNEIKQLFFLKAVHKNVEFSINLCDNFPHEIFIDRYRLKQILTNLIKNAIKYTKKGEISLSFNYLKLTQQHSKEQSIKLIIDVKDTGIGIQRKNLEKIFQSFSRQEGMEQTQLDGPGLGLSITKKLTMLMGGAIKVKSNPGEGSEFNLCFPEILAKFTAGDTLGNTLHSKTEKIEDIQEKIINNNTEIQSSYSNELIDFLHLQKETTWVKFKIKQPINEVKSFAKEIIDAGEEFNNNEVIHYGEQLLSSIENFDIKKMLQILNNFPGLIEALKINT